MRIVVTGASGNVGTSVLDALARDDAVDSIVGVARRLPELTLPKTSWTVADVAVDDLEPIFRGADCVIHLAWLIQPGRDLDLLQAVNVEGSARVFRAVAAAGVGSIVHASSVGAYSPGPKDRRVDEEWPTEGIPSAYYARQKAEVERAARPVRDRGSRYPRRPPAIGADLQARRGVGDSTAVPRTAAAQPAGALVADPAHPGCRPARLPGCPLQRRRRGVSARRDR